jgi:glutathione S-transferase
MPQAERILYVFPISHYCEKSRWNLDAKGLSYREEALVPALHARLARRLAGGHTLPVLVDHGAAFGDSAAIAQHLDQRYPERPLVPRDEAERARALELEAWFGKHAGRAVRQWLYGELGRTRGLSTRVFLEGYSAPVRALRPLLAPLLELGLRKQYHLDEAGITKARATVLEAFDRLDQEIAQDPSRYLVGRAFSIADLSAAALLGPLVAPPESPWASMRTRPEVPESIRSLRASLSARPGWAWVEARYREDRRPRHEKA